MLVPHITVVRLNLALYKFHYLLTYVVQAPPKTKVVVICINRSVTWYGCQCEERTFEVTD